VSDLPNTMLEDMGNAAESSSDKPLEAQPVHKVDETKPVEQED
jgi:hypothetical protein